MYYIQNYKYNKFYRYISGESTSLHKEISVKIYTRYTSELYSAIDVHSTLGEYCKFVCCRAFNHSKLSFVT